MLYITFNDSPQGIYQSQVTDVCRYLRDSCERDVELVAFVSLRNFIRDRRAIKSSFQKSTVLPLLPGIENWRMNRLSLSLLMLFRQRQPAIARGVFATLLAMRRRKISAVTFDARGAYRAEWQEYLKADSPKIAGEMAALEKEALMKADFRIAVSERLVEYWGKEYGYAQSAHVVIPCTLDSRLQAVPQASGLRKELGITENEILLVFSGSAAQWQSVNHLFSLLARAFAENPSLKLLLLFKEEPPGKFAGMDTQRITKKWLPADKVAQYLAAADYGLLYREDSVTNRVSSPVKFAQYLAAGLPVIISENVGDFSAFVAEKKCGLLFGSVGWRTLKRPNEQERNRIRELAKLYFTKKAYAENYKKVAGR